MNIDRSKLNMSWWEDDEGNIAHVNFGMATPAADGPEKVYEPTDNVRIMVTCWPCQITKRITEYDYHPKGIDKVLIKIPVISNFVKKKKKMHKTYLDVCEINTFLGRDSQKIAVAMVNSGDYELDEALLILSTACERCCNVLAHKYLGEDEGYEEYSNEWRDANTECIFCKPEPTCESIIS